MSDDTIDLAPPHTELTRPFFEGADEGKFMLQWCHDCDQPVYYPRYICPHCWGDWLEWREASGRGSIYAFSRHHIPGHDVLAEFVPYTVALIDLEEGVRMLSMLTPDSSEYAEMGAAVDVCWHEFPDGTVLPWFSVSKSQEGKS